MAGEQALVLGSGGLAAIAWITGLLAGLADAGQDVTGADVIIGTSAGANVAAQLGSGLTLDVLLARQTEPALQTAEIPSVLDVQTFGAQLAEHLAAASSPEEAWQRAGAFAVAATTVPEADRRNVIASRLPSHDWPQRQIRLVAVDCDSGTPRVFDAGSGVSLVDAVAASSAGPGSWPPATIGGRRYIDGMVRSPDSADLAAGAERVVVVSPLGLDSPVASPFPLRASVAALRADGSEVTVIQPDEPSRAAFGANPLDPATRRPAAEAGRAQGRAGLPS